MFNKEYYFEMLRRNRILRFYRDGELFCFLTFYITDDIEQYSNRDNQWQVFDDNPNGSICYLDHLITTKEKQNKRDSYFIWKRIKQLIELNFPLVRELKWKRWDKKNNQIKTYTKKISEELCHIS